MIQDLIRKGLAEQQAGRLASAKSIYEQVLVIEPRHPDALNLLGVIALERSDPGVAADLIAQAIQVQPANPGFHANLAHAYLASQRVAEAHGAFRRAATLDPRNPQFAVGAAVCLAMQGSAADAEQQLRKVVQDHPRYALGWYNLGNLLRDGGRHREAMDSYRRVIGLDPGFADAHSDLGRLLHQAQRFDEAEQAYREYLRLQPDTRTGYVNLASLLIDLGRSVEAAKLCQQGIARLAATGSTSELQWMLGSAFAHQGDFASALAPFHAAAMHGNSRALWGYGLALRETGNAQEGLQCLERARDLEPDIAEFRHGMAGIYLSAGNMQSGWREYQQRPARARFAEELAHVKLAEKAGEDLVGKTVLLLREQGLGDELFFLRFARELKSRGAAITYRTNPKIASILARVAALDRVITGDVPLPEADIAMLVGDLPKVPQELDSSPYRARQDTAAAQIRFQCVPRVFYPELPPPLPLTALPRRLRDTRERLSALGPPPYLGLTWRAGTAPEQQGAAWMLHKEIPLERLGAAVRSVNGTLLALQRNPRPGELGELAACARRPMHDLTGLNEDLEAMLALLALVDDYIGVSNTNMHLRAGAGRTARVLMPRPAEWRWLLAGDESPWFPGFRIYRQGPDGDWNVALERLRADLRTAFGSNE